MTLEIRKYLILIFLFFTTGLYAGYNDMVLTPYLYDDDNPYNGNFDLSVGFVTSNGYEDTFICPYSDLDSSKCQLINVTVNNGQTVLKLEDMDDLDVLITANLQLKLKLLDSDVPIIPDGDNYLFNSSAFSILSYKTEYVQFPQAEKLVSSSSFDKPVLVESDVDFGWMLFSNTAPYLGKRDRAHNVMVDVASINVKELYLNYQPIGESFLWKTIDDGIYVETGVNLAIKKFKDGVPVGTPLENVQVVGKIASNEFFQSDSPLTLFSDWVTRDARSDYSEPENTEVMYFEKVTQNIGFGVADLIDRLNSNGILLTGNINTDLVTSGSVFFKNNEFFGVKHQDDINEIITFNSFQSYGSENQLAFFNDANNISSDPRAKIHTNSNSTLTLFDTERFFRLTDSFAVVSSKNNYLFGINSDQGNVVISKNTDFGYKLGVNGKIDAKDYYLRGFPISMQMASGEYFYRNLAVSTEDNYKIYYDRGHIALGAFESMDSRSSLEIGAPLREDNQVPINPALSFTKRAQNSGDDTVYSLGINSSYNDQFFLVNGYDLNVNDPLLSIKKNYLGMGIVEAKANLHVSGNTGMLIQGQLRFFDDVYRQNVIDTFNQAGSQLQFNPYSASFRSGMFFDSENYFQNVGVFSVGMGYSNQVSGNLAAALGGSSQRVSGIYSTAMGGSSNDILSGFSFSGGSGSYIDHHGSFVFSHRGFLPVGVTSVSQDDRLKTTDTRQFLIGTPQNSFAPAYLGINTNNAYGLATIKARSIVPSVFEETLSLSSSNATILVNALKDEKFIDSDGDILVYKDRYFTQYFSANDLPIIVSINSVQVYQNLVATLNNNNHNYWNSNNAITSTNLREWALVPTVNWDDLFMPVLDGVLATPVFNNNANVGIRFHALFVSKNVSKTAEKFNDALKTIGIYDENSSFKQCGNYGTWSPSTITSDIIEGYVDTIDSDLSNELESFTNITTTNVKDFMVEELAKDDVDCDAWQDLYISIATVNKKIYDDDVKNINFPFEESSCNGSDTWQCQYTYYAYSTYLSSTVYSQLFDAIRSNIDRFVLDLDSVASGSYLLSDLDNEFINNTGITSITSVNVQAVLEELLTTNIVLLEGQNQDAVFRVQNNNSINLGFDEFVNNADFAISGNIAIVEPRVESFISTPSLIKIDNLYDPDFDYSSNQPSSYADSLLVRRAPQSQVPSPTFVINSSGIVGLGEVISTDSYYLYISGGQIMADRFQTPAGDLTPPDDVVIVFLHQDTTPNIYFTQGFLGLGVASPNSLLHLKYSNLHTPSDPVLTFDYFSDDIIKVGGASSSNPGFKIGSPDSFYTASALFVSGNQTSDPQLPGFFRSQAGVISGNLGISSTLQVNTDNVMEVVFASKEIQTNLLFLKNNNNQFVKVSSSGFPWNFDRTNNLIYLNDGTLIGVHTSFPQYDLDVSGNLNFIGKGFVNNELISFDVLNNVRLTELFLTTNVTNDVDNMNLVFNDPVVDSKLFVESQNLILQFNNVDFNQTSAITAGEGYCGDFVIFQQLTDVYSTNFHEENGVNPPCLGDPDPGTDYLDYPNSGLNFRFDFRDVTTNFFTYNDIANNWVLATSGRVTENMPILEITGNIIIDLDSPTVNTDIVFPSSDLDNILYFGKSHDTSIRHNGNYWSDSYSFSAVSLNVVITNNSDNDFTSEITGIDIQIDNIDTADFTKSLTNGTEVVGLYVDVQNISVQDSGIDTRGYRYPAVFMGDVLMATSNVLTHVTRNMGVLTGRLETETSYNYLLAVQGTLKAIGQEADLIISDGLFSPSLQVNAGFINAFNANIDSNKARVGINKTNPQVELDIDGNIRASYWEANEGSLRSNYLSHSNDTFIVNQNGFVGFGVTEQADNDGDVSFYKLFDVTSLANLSNSFIYKSYRLDVTGNDLNFGNNVTGLSLAFPMEDDNFFGTMDSSQERVVLKGLDVNLSDISLTNNARLIGVSVNVLVSDNSYAAVFLSGNVGIGTADPGYELDVNGTVFATSFNAIESKISSVNNLTVKSLKMATAASVTFNAVTMNAVDVDTLTFGSNVGFSFNSLVSSGGGDILNLDLDNDISITTMNNVSMLNVNKDNNAKLIISNRLTAVTGNIFNKVELLDGSASAMEVLLSLKSPSINLSIDGDNYMTAGSLTVSNNQYQTLVADQSYLYINESFPDSDSYRYPVNIELQVTTNTINGNTTSFVSGNVKSWNALGIFSGVIANESLNAITLKPHSNHQQTWMVVSKQLDKQANGPILTDTTLDLRLYEFENEDASKVDFTNINAGNNYTAPSLYITATGNVALFPQPVDLQNLASLATFNVFGTAAFENVVAPTLNVATINSIESLFIGEIGDYIAVNSTVTMNATMYVADKLAMKIMTTEGSNNDYLDIVNDEFALYAATANEVGTTADLWMYVKRDGGSGASVNLMQDFTFRKGAIVVFSDKGVPTPSNLMVTTNSLPEHYVLYFDDKLTANRVSLQSTIPGDTVFANNSLTLNSLDIGIERNGDSFSRVIRGLDIQVASANLNDAIVGLRVSMNGLANTTSSFKNAAIFNGGDVLLVSKNIDFDLFSLGKPSANFHIASRNMGDSPNLIIANDNFNLLTVSSNKIGVGVSPNAVLNSLVYMDTQSYFSSTNDGSFFAIKDQNGLPFIDIKQSTNNQITLNSTVSFQNQATSNFTFLDTDSIQLNQSDVFTFDFINNNIGMRQAIPIAQFHAKDVLTREVVDKARKKIQILDVNIGGSDPDITGFDISIGSEENNEMDNAVLKAINVDMTTLDVDPGSVIYGMYVDVTGNETLTANSIVFTAGNVGIGTTRINPRDVLDIEGTLYVGENLLTPSDNIYINAQQVTADTLAVSKGLNVNSDVIWNNVHTDVFNFKEMFYPTGAQYSFDFDNFFQADDITINILSFTDVSGSELYLKPLAKLMIGTSITLEDNQSILVDSGSQKVYMRDVYMDSTKELSVSTINAQDQIIDVYGGISLNNVAKIEVLEAPYFQFSTNTTKLNNSLTVSNSKIWFTPFGNQEVALGLGDTSSVPDGYIPVASQGGLTFNQTLRIEDSGKNTVLIVSKNEILAKLDATSAFPLNGLENIDLQLNYRSPSELNAANDLNMKGLYVRVTSSNLSDKDSADDVVTGVSINMSELMADYYLGGGVLANVKKYAAIFEGGRVLFSPLYNSTIPTPTSRVISQDEQGNDITIGVDVYVSSNIHKDTNLAKLYQDFLVELSTGNNQSVFAIDHTMGANADGSGNQLFVDIGVSRNSTTSFDTNSDYMVQIATTNSDLVSIRSNSNDMFTIKNDTVFIGDTSGLQPNLSVSFNIKPYSASAVIVSMNKLKIDDKGVAVGGSYNPSDRVANVDIRATSPTSNVFFSGPSTTFGVITKNVDHIQFLINTANVTNQTSLAVHPNIDFALITTNASPIFIGHDNSVKNLSFDRHAVVIQNNDNLQAADDSFLSLGVSSNVNMSEIVFGSESLKFMANNNSVLTFYHPNRDGNLKVGLFVDQPTETFTLNRFSPTHHFMHVTDDSGNEPFFIDLNNKIGVGGITTNLVADLTVSGQMLINRIEYSEDAKTRLIVNGTVEVSGNNDTGANPLGINITQNSMEQFIAKDIVSNLNTDIWNHNIAGYAITIGNTSAAGNSDDPHYGLYSDVRDLDAKAAEDSYSYAGVFYGKSGSQYDSKVVIDLVADPSKYWTHHKKEACTQLPDFTENDGNKCLENVNYDFPLTVIASDTLSTDTEILSFRNGDSGITFNFTLVPLGVMANNNNTNLKTDGVFDNQLTMRSFANTLPDGDNNIPLVQSFITDIWIALQDAQIINNDGQINQTNMTQFDNINTFPPIASISENILAVLESFTTQNVFAMQYEFNYNQKEANICVIDDLVGEIWVPESPNSRPHPDFGDCVHSSFVSEMTGTGNKTMFPLAFSTGNDPAFLELFNIARVGINLVKANNAFVNGDVKFSETLVIGSLSDLDVGVTTDYKDTNLKLYHGSDITDSNIGSHFFKTEHGFHMDFEDYVAKIFLKANSKYYHTTPNVHDYVDLDQHKLTVLNKGVIRYRYMSYKTRHQDVRIGQYVPQTDAFNDLINPDATVIFSGGPCISPELSSDENCSENLDVLSIGRDNRFLGENIYASHLKVNLQELAGNDDIQFSIGSTTGSEFQAPLIAGAYMDTSYVGIGRAFDTLNKPKSVLHVKDYSDFSSEGYVEFFQTSSIDPDLFLYGAEANQEMYFTSKEYSYDNFGIPTSLRTAAEEGAGCDGDYRVYGNEPIWDNFASIVVGTTTSYEFRDDNYYWNDPADFPRTVYAPVTKNEVISGIGNGVDAYQDTINVSLTDGAVRESVYSCHYFAWIVKDVLGVNYQGQPIQEVGQSGPTLQTNTLPAFNGVTDQPDCSIDLYNWKDFVTKFNAGCYIQRMKDNNIASPDLLRLDDSSNSPRFVPRSHASLPVAASPVTTYDGGTYRNYGSIAARDCKKVDFAAFPDTDTVARDTPLTHGELTDSEKRTWSYVTKNEDKDANYLMQNDKNDPLNMCRTNFVNPVKIRRSGESDFNNNDYLTHIEALDVSKPILALNFVNSTIGEGTNFASFFSGPVPNVPLGEIEGLDTNISSSLGAGVQFSSPGRDYAEYMIKRDPKEVINPGDIVGVFSGEISLDTHDADTIMVISSAPVVVGNFPGDDVKHLYELIAFLGQVPVKVIGGVNPGDILVPSGKGDGTAIAVHEDNLLSEQLPLIIGRAWDGYEGDDVAYINTLVGFSFNIDIINRYIHKAEQRLDDEKDANQQLDASLKAHLKEQQDLIKRLEKALSMNKDSQ